MLTALKDSRVVLASEVSRRDNPFRCKFCGFEMRYRAGKLKSPHFYHVPNYSLAMVGHVNECLGMLKYGSGGESAEHMNLKMQLFLDAKRNPKIKHVEMEYRVGNSITDVAILGEYRKIAVEIQLSPLSWEKMFQRMFEHYHAGFSTFWITKLAVSIETLKDPSNRSSQWKITKTLREIHDLSRGTLFNYAGNLTFDTIHLMGYAYETYKLHKVGFKQVSLFELVDEEIQLENGDPWGKVTTLKKDERWWLNPK